MNDKDLNDELISFKKHYKNQDLYKSIPSKYWKLWFLSNMINQNFYRGVNNFVPEFYNGDDGFGAFWNTDIISKFIHSDFKNEKAKNKMKKKLLKESFAYSLKEIQLGSVNIEMMIVNHINNFLKDESVKNYKQKNLYIFLDSEESFVNELNFGLINCKLEGEIINEDNSELEKYTYKINKLNQIFNVHLISNDFVKTKIELMRGNYCISLENTKTLKQANDKSLHIVYNYKKEVEGFLERFMALIWYIVFSLIYFMFAILFISIPSEITFGFFLVPSLGIFLFCLGLLIWKILNIYRYWYKKYDKNNMMKYFLLFVNLILAITIFIFTLLIGREYYLFLIIINVIYIVISSFLNLIPTNLRKDTIEKELLIVNIINLSKLLLPGHKMYIILDDKNVRSEITKILKPFDEFSAENNNKFYDKILIQNLGIEKYFKTDISSNYGKSRITSWIILGDIKKCIERFKRVFWKNSLPNITNKINKIENYRMKKINKKILSIKKITDNVYIKTKKDNLW